MRHPHVSTGGRYPVLRSIAVLHLAAAIFVAALCAWQAVRVLAWGGDETTYSLIGPTTTVGGKIAAAVCWLGVAFLGVLLMLGAAELMKLFIDIEHHTRMIAQAGRASAPAGVMADGADGTFAQEGPAIPLVSDRKLFAGEETAEGALLRGH